MESHIHMTYHQARLPLFGHVVRRLKRNQNNPVQPSLKSRKRQFDDELNKGTLEAKKDIESLKKQKLDKPSRGISSKNSSVKHNTQLRPLRSDADYMESHIPMIYHQARLPLFGHVVRRLKRNQNNQVHPALKSRKRQFDDELNKGTLEDKKYIEQPLKKQKVDKPNRGIYSKNSSATVRSELSRTPKVENLQLQPLSSDAEMIKAERKTEPKPKIWLVPIEKLVKPHLLLNYYTVFGNVEQEENKDSLYLDKHRCKPDVSHIAIQTDFQNGD